MKNNIDLLTDGFLATWGVFHLFWVFLVVIGLIETPLLGVRILTIAYGLFLGLLLLGTAFRYISVYGVGLLAFLELTNVAQLALDGEHVNEYTMVMYVDDGAISGVLVLNTLVVVALIMRTMALARARDSWWPYSLF